MIVQADSENANRFLNSITRRFFVWFFLSGRTKKLHGCTYPLRTWNGITPLLVTLLMWIPLRKTTNENSSSFHVQAYPLLRYSVSVTSRQTNVQTLLDLFFFSLLSPSRLLSIIRPFPIRGNAQRHSWPIRKGWEPFTLP
jgi:hypothetical protein